MAESGSATRTHARIELHWNATYTPNIRQAIVEELDEDGNDEVDRPSANTDTLNIRYEAESLDGFRCAEGTFGPIGRQSATTVSHVGEYESSRTNDTSSNLADGCPSISGVTDDDLNLDATKANGSHSPTSQTPSRTMPMPSMQGVDERSTMSHTGATWADASESEFDIPTSDTVSGDQNASTRMQKRKLCPQALKHDPMGDLDARCAKRQRYHVLTESARDADIVIRDVGSHRPRPGHYYDRVQVTGHARVHMGDNIRDQVIINHNYLGLFAAMDLRLAQNTEASEKAAILRLAASIIIAVILNALVRLLHPLQSAICRAMPQLMQERIPIPRNLLETHALLFEDALGRFDRIDLHVVADWTAFHYRLTCAFANKPGYRRVAVADYRLFDRTRSDQLINPRRPPPFGSIFRPNMHLRMSMHFKLSELHIICCPTCGVDKLCESGTRATCKNAQCGSHYRGQVEKHPMKIAFDETGGNRRDSNEQHGNMSQIFLEDVEENHAPFTRVSVTRQPTTQLPLRAKAAAIADYRARMMNSVGQVQHDQVNIVPQMAQSEYGGHAARGGEPPREQVWVCPYPGCLRADGGLVAFSRKYDLNRHAQIHMPRRPLYPCPVVGCHRVGQNALPRPDKLFEHIKVTHGTRERPEHVRRRWKFG